MRKLFREPLLHFLLLGLGIFVLYALLGGRDGRDDQIVISRGQIDHLTAGFARLHQRPPVTKELDGLIDEAIREEIFYREARLLGLDEDDIIVRRRMMQKLEFMSEDLAPVPEPTDAQLQDYLRAHPQKFGADARYSLSQVYLDPQRHGARLESDAEDLLVKLRQVGASADTSKFGDPFLLERRFNDVTASELGRLFGARFADALTALPINEWRGPVPSGYGVHLVLIEKREAGRTPPLEQVRAEVLREWTYTQRQQANERFYADLRKRYDVTVERPATNGASAKAAEMSR